jgi:hypothetical protein
MVHEALGHGIAALLTGDRILSISTVALQNASASRLVSASGTAANCIAGAVSLLLLSRVKALSASAYFLWLFGAFNLFNSGYLVASSITGSGDWANVIAGLRLEALWRILLAALGVAVYVFAVRWLVRSLLPFCENGELALPDVGRLVFPAYLTAGLIMTVASFFNPIGPSLILPSGIAPSFGLNAGLLLVPQIVAQHARNRPIATRSMAFSKLWLIAAIAATTVFIAVLGPGIRF